MKEEMNDKPLIARAYIRVSLQGMRGKEDKGGRNFISPEMQLRSAKDYVQLRLKDYIFDEETSLQNKDIDRSASRLKWQQREGIVAHYEAAKRKEFNALIVYKLSRFARNAREGLELFDMFEKVGCAIHSVNDNLDGSSASGRMMRTMLLAIAEMESENTSDWVKDSFLARAHRGLTHGKPPFWITRDGDNFILNERKNAIRRLVDLRLEGVSYTHIARKLNQEGFKAPAGGDWDVEKVRLYLVHDKLLLLQGNFVYGRNKPDDDPGRVVVPGVFPAIITSEEADAISGYNRLQRQVWMSGNPRKAASTKYILSGLLRCSSCGSRFKSRTSGKPTRAGYMCIGSTTNNVPHPNGIAVSADIIEDAVLRVVQEVLIDYQEQVKMNLLPKPVVSPASASLEKQILKNEKNIDKLFNLHENDKIKTEDFERRYKLLVDEREKLRKLTQEGDANTTLQFIATQMLAPTDQLTPENARRMILAFVERVDTPVAAETDQGKTRMRKCRAAWVTLKIPMRDGTRRILAPFYSVTFTGVRVLLDRE